VAGLGHLRAVPDEDDFTGDLAGARAPVRRPLAPGVEPAHGGTEQIQAAGRPWARGRLENERLEERSLVAAGSQTRGGQPGGDLLGGLVAPRRARPASLHLGCGQGLHAVGERSGLRRHDRRPRGGAGGADDQGGREDKCDETTDHPGILLYGIDWIGATRPPVRRTRSSGVSLKTVLGWPAAAQISGHRIRSSSIRMVSRSAWATGATPPMAKPVRCRTKSASARPTGSAMSAATLPSSTRLAPLAMTSTAR